MSITKFRKLLVASVKVILLMMPLNRIVAQNKPSSNTIPAATNVAAQPSAYAAGIPVNYVRSWQPLVPMTTEQAVLAGSATNVQQTTQYADGLGRPLQTVARGFTSAGQDLVSPVVYDAFGRETYKYLPYAAGNNGGFKTDPFEQQKLFMQSQYPGEQVYYSKTDYEASPLNRVQNTYAPGNSWAGNNRGVAASYETNTSAQEVVIWNIGFIEEAVPAAAGYYAAGTLYRTITTDERGKRTVEYKDKEGQVVLKKVEIASTAPSVTAHAGWLCTYYVYDDLNQLRFVMPPLAVDAFEKSSWNLFSLQESIDELCFRYGYDGRRRMTAKKVPGAGWVYMIYDQRDRLVFTQDANMRTRQQWLTTIYDDLNRPIQTGMLIGGTRSGLQNYIENAAASQNVYNGQKAGTPSDLYINKHDGRSSYNASKQITFESGMKGAGEFVAQIVSPDGEAFASIQNASINPANALPPGATNYIPLSFTYYDNYSWTSRRYSSVNDSKLGIGANAWGEPLPGTTIEAVKGLVTGSRFRILENPNDLNAGDWLETANFYDSKGRIVQVQSNNYKGGEDIVTSRYDFSGKVISNYAVHNNPSGNTNNRIYTEMDYDHGGRLTEVRKILNDNNETRRIVAHHEYDELGQLKNKALGQKAADDNRSAIAEFLESQDYAYNIRGWLKGLNWQGYNQGSTRSSGINGRWFAMDLSYDWGYVENQYNGNIAGMRWQSKGDGDERSYGYGYDAANRLMKADFQQRRVDIWGTTTTAGSAIDFSVKMGDGLNVESAYDVNGNIKRMQQWGLLKGGGNGQIDDLNYEYHKLGYSNKLKAVTDAITANNGLGDFTDKNAGDDYGYDLNGNLIVDKNKRLDGVATIDQAAGNGAIIYNHLNLPWKITVKDDAGAAKGTITYIYDAAGNKLEKRVEELPAAGNNQTAKNTYTSYLAGHVYENNVLQFFSHEEGRIRPQRNSAGVATGVYYYDYFIKDHLGNTRMVLTDEKQIDAYPVASLEAATINSEKTYYDIPDASRIATSEVPGYPVTGASNAWVQRLNGNGQKTGTSIVLRVMSGDKVSISADSWYASGVTPGSPSNLSVADLIASLAGGIAGSGGASHSVAQVQQNPNLQSGLGSFLTNVVNADNAANGNLPKAYLNYVLFDEQLNVVITNDGKNSGIDRVGSGGALKSHQITQRSITRNGYLYIYVSNETPGLNVIFDNLKVTHVRGELTEETHYYPFGLTMAGISAKAAGKLQNKHKFNGGNELQSEEFSDGSGLELYDAVYRMYDPQIGRFRQIDRLGDISHDISLYTFGSNNPILRNDPLGLIDTAINQSNPRVIEGVTVKTSNHRYQTMQWFGGPIKTDTHFKGNLETFTYRVRNGENLFQNGDRYSYVQDVLNGRLPEWYLREEDADQFVKDFYLIYFSLLALPEDVVAITGLASSGMKSLPALSRLLKETSTVERVTSNFAKSQLKSITSLERQIAIHIEKLKAYKADPWKFDNLGHLKNAPNDAVREKIIQSRISHLEKEIQIFQDNIKKISNNL